MQVVLLRVGIDTGSGGIHGPLFKDGSFEYVPIRDRKNRFGVNTDTYTNTKGRHGRLEAAYPHCAQVSPQQLGIQELCRHPSLAVGDVEDQGLLKGKATGLQRHALGKWNQTQVLSCAGPALRAYGHHRYQQSARAAQEGEHAGNALTPEAGSIHTP